MTDKNLGLLIDNLAAAKAAADAARKKYDALKAELLTELNARGTNRAASEAHQVKVTESTQTRLDNKRIKLEFPEIYAEYGKTSITIRVTID